MPKEISRWIHRAGTVWLRVQFRVRSRCICALRDNACLPMSIWGGENQMPSVETHYSNICRKSNSNIKDGTICLVVRISQFTTSAPEELQRFIILLILNPTLSIWSFTRELILCVCYLPAQTRALQLDAANPHSHHESGVPHNRIMRFTSGPSDVSLCNTICRFRWPASIRM